MTNTNPFTNTDAFITNNSPDSPRPGVLAGFIQALDADLNAASDSVLADAILDSVRDLSLVMLDQRRNVPPDVEASIIILTTVAVGAARRLGADVPPFSLD